MKKIIYSSILKKIVSLTMLIILLSELFLPGMVFADKKPSETANKMYDILSTHMDSVHTDIQPDRWQKAIDALKERGGNIYVENDIIYIEAQSENDIEHAFSQAVTSNVNLFLPENNGIDDYKFVNINADMKIPGLEAPEEGEEDTRTDKQKIMAWIKDNLDTDGQFTEHELEIIVDDIATFDANGKMLTVQNDNDGNPRVVFDENGNVLKVTLDSNRVIELTGDVLAGQQTEDAQDPDSSLLDMLGGILMSPIFYLVNFIADAVLSNVGAAMYPESGMSIHGLDLLKGSPVDYGYTRTYDYTVVMPNVLGAIQYPNIKYTPEEIFAGKINLLSIDFISGNNPNSGWMEIRKVISSWYKVLRMIAIIGLLSVLIYTGIKIIISSNAKDKAKYKEWIINWFIAVAILFSMHYIMSFIISVIGEINNLIGNAAQGIRVIPSRR